MMQTDSKENENNDKKEQQGNAMAAFGEKIKDLEDALNILYIKNNASGRNKFREKWSIVANYIFGETLIDFDNNGTTDFEKRAEEEERADERRVLLKQTIADIYKKSVEAGMLQFDYVGKVIDKFGPDISKILYAEDIIRRVRPGLLSSHQKELDNIETQKQEKQDADDAIISAKAAAMAQPEKSPLSPPIDEDQLRQKEKEILKNAPDDDMDDIKPIDTSKQNPTETEPAKETIETPTETVDEGYRKETETETVAEPQKTEGTGNDFEIPETLPEKPKEVNLSDEQKEQNQSQADPQVNTFEEKQPENKGAVTKNTKPEKGTYVAIFNKVA